MRSKKWLSVVLGICIGIFGVHGEGVGQGGINLGELETLDADGGDYTEGKVILLSRITTSARYDTNFFNTHEAEHEAMTYSIKPGVTVGYETAKAIAQLDYDLNALFYDHLDDLPEGIRTDRAEDFIEHLLNASVRYHPTDRLFLGLEDSFFRTLDTGYSDRFGQPVEREAITINRITPAVYYKFGEKFAGAVKYRNTLTDYDRPDVDDSVENRAIFDLIYNFNATTSLDLQYQRWYKDYDGPTIDYTSDQVDAYFQKEFSNTTIGGGMGYHYREFDETLDEMEAFVYRLDVKWQEARTHVRAALEHNLNEYGDRLNSYYKATLFKLEAGRIFMEKYTTGLEARYQLSDYDWNREDDLYKLLAKFGYIYTDWLTLDLHLGYENRDSNQSVYDYDNTFVLVGVRSAYDFGSR